VHQIGTIVGFGQQRANSGVTWSLFSDEPCFAPLSIHFWFIIIDGADVVEVRMTALVVNPRVASHLFRRHLP
jgi:hypothetical protein